MVSSAPENRYFSFVEHNMKISAMSKINEVIPEVRWRIETSLTRLPHESIKQLQSIYVFTNSNVITSFLLQNTFLFEILFEAPQRIWEIFGGVPLYLEVHRDPEEGWDELFIVIKSSYNTDEALRLEDQLMEEWFLERITETKGKLNIVEEPL